MAEKEEETISEERFERLLQQYVRLVVRAGANVQKGQEVKLSISTELYPFARLLVKEAYEAGAKSVQVDWQDQDLTKLAYQHEDVDTLGEMKKWEVEKLAYETETLPAQIHITSADPEGLKDLDPAKLSEVQKRRYPVVKPYRDKSDNKYQWIIAGAPSAAWAKTVFPDLPEKEAVRALWLAIFKTSRISEDEDPLKLQAPYGMAQCTSFCKAAL